MCKTYRQRVFCPGDTHRTEIVRTVRTARNVNGDHPNSAEELENSSTNYNENNNCKCHIATAADILFLPPVIDYSLERTCAGCIEEERDLVMRVMALKRAIAEEDVSEARAEMEGGYDSTGDGAGYGNGHGYGNLAVEFVPIGMRVEVGLGFGSLNSETKTAKTKANDNGDGDGDASASVSARAVELRSAGVRCRTAGEGVSEHEPSYLPELPLERGNQEMNKSGVAVSAPALVTGHGISKPNFLPNFYDVNDRRRTGGTNGGETAASTTTSKRFSEQAVHINNQQQYATCKPPQPLI
ncbi:hypothetical protein SMACR_02722 [Sordaria macrospora]|uniref:WGS project CABT00000000 data, contig 2.11 n=2 Tax=Sordaria macrospora TaxID=5147 RepID=F7VXA2_SORMK|nr:uncharacterized protein SMAC_02722 [Sordaria macrospora k-hell]KAA8636340.1 hypothetical protein SMACR_02722 [Sordaria macrospora]WPJ60447.1 hypothetical protein SMAC4_02722 [Sordaria macrospora]CCC10144.1 unnamed protein product [Sordaria macrospora k-hell]